MTKEEHDSFGSLNFYFDKEAVSRFYAGSVDWD